jgi:hypothetical protein
MNRVYGKLTLRLWEPERQLFPGLIAFFLATSGIIFQLKKNKKKIPLIQKKIVWRRLKLPGYITPLTIGKIC